MSEQIRLSRPQLITLAALAEMGDLTLDPIMLAGSSGPVTATVNDELFLVPVDGGAIPEGVPEFERRIVL